jgi:hypothetical protein
MEPLTKEEVDELLSAIKEPDGSKNIERWEYTQLEGTVNSFYTGKANE